MANRLADASSPYLQQHAANPVDWWPWSPEALAEARRRDSPLFVSVGYAACHWCHVMAHESFQDPEIATLLNEHFVNIKVDREERPDIDAVYMEATTALTGSGGWPMSVFCTPDGKPFYAGTYFPPTPRYGRPSFPQVVGALAQAWRDRRDEVLDSADHIVGELARLGAQSPEEATPVDLERAYAGLVAAYDSARGGFGGAPKFPPTLVLDALLARGDSESLRMVDATLQAMIGGGLHDQLGGGFARYSVDADWVVPHFEKMLYDNALLLGTLSRRWGHDGSEAYARTARLLVGWLEREMRTPEGAYASSLDADSVDERGQHAEGAFYVWTREQLREVLGDEDAELAAAAYSVTVDGTFEHGASTLQAVAEADLERLESVRRRLFEARERRPRPARDDKVVAAWNGLLIDALVSGAMILDEPEWLGRAAAAAEHLWAVHWVDGGLRRTSRDGVAGTAAGVLEDYGALALGFGRLASATADGVWLERATDLLEVVERHLTADDGGWYDTADDAETLYARPRDVTDNVTPSGASAVIAALRLVARLGGDPDLHERADRAYAAASGLITRAPRFAGWLLADAWSRVDAAEIAVVGGAIDLLRTAWRYAPAGSVVVAGNPGEPGIGLLEGREQPGAYVCRDFVCRRPVTTPAELRTELVG